MVKLFHIFVRLVGTGRFAYDVLQEWKQLSPETFIDLNYSIIEMSPFHRKLQQKLFVRFLMCHIIRRIVKWENRSRDSFSNELFDAFPVEVIEKRNGILYEVRVTYTEEGNLQKYVGRYIKELVDTY